MGLIGKLFKGSEARPDAGAASAFPESQVASADAKPRNAPRRELVRLVLRETMRRHGIPSDWLECRTLSVLTRDQKSGMHVQFLVRQGDHELLNWVHAFQESFWQKILRTDPGAREWLFSVGWEFYGKSQQGFQAMPDPSTWRSGRDTETLGGDTLPPELADDDPALATDLQALQAAMSMPAELTPLRDTAGRTPRR